MTLIAALAKKAKVDLSERGVAEKLEGYIHALGKDDSSDNVARRTVQKKLDLIKVLAKEEGWSNPFWEAQPQKK